MTENAPDPLPQTGLPQAGSNCYRIETASQFSVIVDAEDYFRHARTAMLQARRRITLIGWDFDSRILLDRDKTAEGPARLGEFIYWLVERNPELEVFLLRWDLGALATLSRGSTLFTLLKWMRHPRIHMKLDGVHPTASSHHQKIVVIDDCLAFCGGIDMTGDRWDTRDHLPDDERRRRPTTRKRYKPWHDATTAITGPATGVIAEIARDRWLAAGGTPDPEPLTGQDPCWPEGLPVQFHDMPLAVSRSIPEMDHRTPVHEIERMWVDQIARAKRHIYIESQYFASRIVAEAMARRLGEDDGPEIVIVNPLGAQGWLEPVAMDTARARLVEALHKVDKHQRLRMYHPFDAGGDPIYVHAKVMIVDDAILKVGSSNLNNRSMRLDTECDVTIDTALSGGEGGAAVTAVRDDLLAEHLGVDVAVITEAMASSGSLIATIESLRGDGRSLRPYEVPDLSEVEKWLADNEVLDPNGPSEMFEPAAKRGLLHRLKRRRH